MQFRGDFRVSNHAEICQLTFPEIESVLLNCLPRPRIGALHIPQVISSFDNTQELIEIYLKKD